MNTLKINANLNKICILLTKKYAKIINCKLPQQKINAKDGDFTLISWFLNFLLSGSNINLIKLIDVLHSHYWYIFVPNNFPSPFSRIDRCFHQSFPSYNLKINILTNKNTAHTFINLVIFSLKNCTGLNISQVKVQHVMSYKNQSVKRYS